VSRYAVSGHKFVHSSYTADVQIATFLHYMSGFVCVTTNIIKLKHDWLEHCNPLPEPVTGLKVERSGVVALQLTLSWLVCSWYWVLCRLMTKFS